jgi:hypothetical protein
MDEETKAAETAMEEESMVAEILTSEENRMPSIEDYFQLLKESNKGREAAETEAPGFLRDIRIEFALRGPGGEDTVVRLLSRPHQMGRGKNPGEQKEVDIVEETEMVNTEGEIKVERVFSVALAEAGIYTFIIENGQDKAYEGKLLFRLYEWKEGERLKEYGIELSPGKVLKFKFALPEAVFWDDEDYFTGMVEGPDSLTKFNEETGLIWKEEKDY